MRRLSAALIGFTGDTVGVAIHLRAIARLASKERRCTGSASFVAIAEIDRRRA